MNPELKALIDAARERGASMTEINAIIKDFYGLKKKDQPEGALPSQPTSEVDSLDSSASTNLGGEQGITPSGSGIRSRIHEGYTPIRPNVYVPDHVADILNQTAENFDNAYTQILRDKFSVDRYEDLLIREGGVDEVNAELLDAYKLATTENERYEAKSNLVDYLLVQEDPDFEVNRYLLAGVNENVFRNMAGIDEVTGDYVQEQKYTLAERVSEAVQSVGGQVAMDMGPSMRQLIPEDIRNNPEELSKFERYMWDEHNLALDFNNDTYIGGYEFLKKDAESSGAGLTAARAWHESMSGMNKIMGDAAVAVFGEDNWFSNWAFSAAEESDKMAQEASERLPFSLKLWSERTDDMMGQIANASPLMPVNFDSLERYVDDGLRMFGESAPMMGAALVAGVASRGRAARGANLSSLRGLAGAERVAEARKIIEAGKAFKEVNKFSRLYRATGGYLGGAQKTTVSARVMAAAGRAQNRGALAATTFMGMGTSYNAVRDEDWFQQMNGLEKAGYTSAMGFLEGAPAFVATSIGTNILANGGTKAAESWARGALMAVFGGAAEEGITEGVTAAGQYYLSTAANPNMKFSYEGLWEATKEGFYAGVTLGGGVAGAASAFTGTVRGTRAGINEIRSWSMGFSSIPSLRDSLQITKLAKEYDAAPTKELRAEIGQKISDTIQRAWDKKLGRVNFYKNLAETNPEMFAKLEGLQSRIAKLGIEYARTQDADSRKALKEQVSALIDERAKLENELGLDYSIDINSEFGRITRGLSKIDKRYNGYGEIFQGDVDSVTVTGENADAVLDAINQTTMDTVSGISERGVFKSGETMKRAMKNAVTVAKALAKTGNFVGVTIHKTIDSYADAVGVPKDQLGRGMWAKKGEIHLFAPLIMENTGFHEAYHDLILEAIGPTAVQQLAESLFRGLTGDIRTKYINFTRAYSEGTLNPLKAIRENPLAAEEFLVELLADMTGDTANVEVSVKRGLVNAFKKHVKDSLNAMGIDVDMTDTDPRIQDLVTALQKVTGQLEQGEAVTGTTDLREALIRAGYNAMAIQLEDLTPKAQGVYARNRDVEETTDAVMWAAAMTEATDRMRELKKKLFLQVDAMTAEDAQKILDDGGKLFIMKDGMGGAYLKADGYMGGLFKNPDSELVAISGPLQTIRARNGGKFYDAFATKLEAMYVSNGWKPVARLDFNPEFAPEGWDDADSPLKDQPDVVFFVRGEGKVGEGVRMTDYMEAYEYAERLSNGKAQAVIKSLTQDVGTESFFAKSGFTEAELSARETEIKLPEDQRQKRVAPVVEAARRYYFNEIGQGDYIEIVRREQPISPMVAVPDVPSILDIAAALKSNQIARGIIDVNKQIPDGYEVALRLDIPAYEFYDIWVVTAHEGRGQAIAYGQTGLITDVEFVSAAKGAFNIAVGESPEGKIDPKTGKPRKFAKSTIARMHGKWKNHDSESLRERAVEIMASEEYNMDDVAEGKIDGWIQVGMNPFRHSWFYDKRDGNPIVNADEVIQIGALVLAKGAVKALPSDERFAMTRPDGSVMKFQKSVPGETATDTSKMFSNKAQIFGRFENKYAENDKDFKKLMEGIVVHNVDMDELLQGRGFITSSPDNMMVGQLYFDGELIFEGGGGMFYPVRTGNVWAVAQEKEAKEIADKLNELRRKSPDGKAYFVLVSGTQEKLFSNTGALRATEIILRKLVEQGVMQESVFNKLLIDSFKQAYPKKQPIPMTGTRAEIVERILSHMSNVTTSTFGKRKYLTDRLFVNLGNALVDNDAARQSIGEMLGHDGNVGKKQGGSVTKRIVSQMLTERLLQGTMPGQVYAAVEIDSDVTFGIEEGESVFPAAIYQVDENGNKKPPKMHLFSERPMAEKVYVTERGWGREAFVEKFHPKYTGKININGNLVDSRKAADAAWTALLGLRNQAYGVARLAPKSQSVVDYEAKAQDNLLRIVSQMIDAKYPTPKVIRDRRKKNPVVGIEDVGQTELFSYTYVKAEVIKTLMESGFTKDGAESLYKRAVAYKEGRVQGKREGMKIAMKNAAETRKISTKAKNLKKALEQLKDKSNTFNQFLSAALELIDERMKENAKTPFTRSQVMALIKYVRQAHKTSAKKASENGLDAMQDFIDKISVIFDQRDAKAELQKYLDGIRHAQGLQQRIKRMAKTRGRGAAPKSVASYARVANGLAAINPALLPQNELADFVNTLMQTISSMSKSKAVFDEEVEAYVGVAFPKTRASILMNKLSSYRAMEELGRQALFMNRAAIRAEKNGTTIEEEYNKIVKNYERSRLSSSRRAILNFIDDNPTIQHPDTGETIVLDETNPAHIDIISQILADQAALKEELQKDAIIYDVLIPRIVANIEKLLEDTQIAEILGIYTEEDLDLARLTERLQKLKRHHIINLDYRLDDYIVNDSVYGIGYMHSLVKGVIDMPAEISRLRKNKGLKSRSRVLLGPLDTVNSYLSNLIPTDRISFAKLRNAIGLGALTTSFAKADFIHSQIVELIEAEIDRITEEGGSVKGRVDRAIAQIYSMARQLPEFEGERGGAEASWYLELRNAMRRTIDYYNEQKSFDPSEREEFEDAFNYLFGVDETLPELMSRIENERGDVVQLVQFVADIHTTLMPQFKNYVERYLGKELVVEENYTAFEVIPETGVRDVDDMLKLRMSLSDQIASSSLSNSKKVAGSSFERNPRSLKGNNRIGLDFLSINERTIRDNVILSHTVGDVVVASHALNSDAMKELIPDAKVRNEYERKVRLYVQQDTAKTPPVFQPTFNRFLGVPTPKYINPINLLRNAVIVKAFGSFGIQTLKQSTVLMSVMFQTKNPIQAIPYLLQTVAEMAAFSLNTLAREDSKMALDNGRYKLLQNSPVFQRDYESGNIDPYTGGMNLDQGKLSKLIDSLTNISLKNLKGTDKVAAVASWFTFYGDALISEGIVESYDQINWDYEAANPNKTALSYADMMVNKDQAASTPREAADLYQNEKGVKNMINYMAQNILLPFSRFAVNKKRSISSDAMRMWYGDTEAKKEGGVAMLGHAAELTLFAYIGKVMIPSIAAIFMDDDEEELPKDNMWREIATQVLTDAQPLPPFGVFDSQIKGLMNRYLWYPMDVMREGDFNLGDDDGYERWTRLGKGAQMYYEGAPKDPFQGFTRGIGPYGDFIDDARTIIANVGKSNNKVVTSSGMEYYVRPEDKDAMMLHYYLKMFLAVGQVAGLGSKEIDILVREMDDLPRDRRLSNEEALAAYETIAQKYGAKLEAGEGKERITDIVGELSNPFDKIRATNSFSSSVKPFVAEKHMETAYPEEHRKYMREVRKLPSQLKNARDYYAYLRGKKQDMSSEEFARLKSFIDTYFSIVKPAFYTEGRYIESIEE